MCEDGKCYKDAAESLIEAKQKGYGFLFIVDKGDFAEQTLHKMSPMDMANIVQQIFSDFPQVPEILEYFNQEKNEERKAYNG